MVGTILGNRYQLTEKIGEGGMAVVYKAKCLLLNRYVAVKILKDEYSGNEEFMDKFRKEATAAASVSANNIVNIYDMIYLHINSKNKVSKMLFTHIGFKICDEIKYFSLKKELINKYFK